MNGIIGKKIGMTSVFDDAGNNLACTVIEAGPCVITQVKTDDGNDGYNSLQLGFGEVKAKNSTKAMVGHFENAKTAPKRKVVEFRDFDLDALNGPTDEEGNTADPAAKAIGDVIEAWEVFQEGDKVNVVGTSKGKGFQGVVKRHNFRGVNDATHGQHNRQRAPGSIGAASYPAKVFKGMRMAGRTGGKRITTENLEVVKIFPEENIILIKGAVPGHKGAFVIIEK